MSYARWISSAFWPVSVWTSLANFAEHADDYVERTAPIIGVAIAFWIIVGAVIALTIAVDEAAWLRILLFFLPIVYLIGFGMHLARDDEFTA
jgi:hypothetical protein